MSTDIFPEHINEPILLLDIGSGTQDVLYAQAGINVENWPRFVLPAPAKAVAQKIAVCTLQKTPIHLSGGIMGGGFFSAVKDHLKQNIPMSATPTAALSLYDDISKVKDLGIQILENTPLGYENITLADFDKRFWIDLFEHLQLPFPRHILAAVQDHGVHTDMGNRQGRFTLWRNLMKQNQDPTQWIFKDVPKTYTRLNSLQNAIGGGFVADTGTAALLGALSDPKIRARSFEEGILIINVGNSHILAFSVYCAKVYGIYEHHTSMLSISNLEKELNEFRLQWIPDEAVRASGGHGSVFTPSPEEAEGFKPTYILGPKRDILSHFGQLIAPHGDMMQAGCFGLLYGYSFRQ